MKLALVLAFAPLLALGQGLGGTGAQGQFIDCVGQVLTDADCAHAGLGYTTCAEWLGDGSCDNGFTLTDSDVQMFLNCEAYGNDQGDCNQNGDFSCSDQSLTGTCSVTDPATEIIDCWGQVLTDADCAVADLGYTTCGEWLGDGSCDGGQHLSDADLLLNFNCKAFQFDMADCYTGTLSPSLPPTNYPSMTPSIAPTRTPTVSPTKAPSPAPTNYPSSVPTISPTNYPTLTPTIDYWSYDPQNQTPGAGTIDNIHFGPFWKAEGGLWTDQAGLGILDAVTFFNDSPPQAWNNAYPDPVTGAVGAESANVSGAGRRRLAVGDQYSSGILSGWVWIPADVGSITITVSNSHDAWFWLGGLQVAGIPAATGYSFEVSASSQAIVAGAWNKLQAIVASNGGVGTVSIDTVTSTPECTNMKGDSFCNYWAQNNALCADSDLNLFCKKTCRVQQGCVLPGAISEAAIYPFEHGTFNGAAGKGDEGDARNGVTIATDPVRGGVADVNGAGDVVTNFVAGEPVSVCAWVNPDQSTNPMTVVDSGAPGSCGDGQGIKIAGGNFVIYNHGADVDTQQPFHPGQWQHVCAVFEASNIKFYFNGMLRLDQAYTLNVGVVANAYSIGAYCADPALTGTDSGSNQFEGQLDDVAFYNLALNTHEIATVYSQSTHQGLDLVVGTRVDVNWQGLGSWYTGSISAVNPATPGSPETYDIIYDDGDAESNVPISRIKIRTTSARSSAYRLRESVMVNKYNLGVKYEGLIRVVQNNGLYTVEYTSGDVETNIPYSRIHGIVKYLRGTKIRARQCFWYDGRIDDVNPNGSYLIKFLDGSGFFSNVDYDDLQPANQVTFAVGDTVEYTKDDQSVVDAYILQANIAEDEYLVGDIAGNVYMNVPSSRLTIKAGTAPGGR